MTHPFCMSVEHNISDAGHIVLVGSGEWGMDGLSSCLLIYSRAFPPQPGLSCLHLPPSGAISVHGPAEGGVPRLSNSPATAD